MGVGLNWQTFLAPSIGHLQSKSLPSISLQDSDIYKIPKRRQIEVLPYRKIQ
jgi:hypothetical protein